MQSAVLLLLLAACSDSGEQSDSRASDDPSAAAAPASVDAELASVPIVQRTLDDPWFQAGRARIGSVPQPDLQQGRARNIILFVGDGMGLSTETAARILAGQGQGLPGEDHVLNFDSLPVAGLAKTYNVDAQVPDSAGTMTAIMTGVKTRAGVLGVDEGARFGDCASAAGHELVTALELAELAGLATGIVSTTRVTHATPAATYAKSVHRGWEDDAALPDTARSSGCTDIARQLIEFESRQEARHVGVDVDGIDVVFGGGRQRFLPTVSSTETGVSSGMLGSRLDGRDLLAEWNALYPCSAVALNLSDFEAIDSDGCGKALGLFNDTHLHYESARRSRSIQEPSLTDMTRKAIELLSGDDDGYFLMVESGRIDHAHHAGSALGALLETLEFDRAVGAALELIGDDTLLIVTADHGHVFTMTGHARRGNPILGTVIGVGRETPELADDGLPYTTLGYHNGLGFRDLGDDSVDFDASYAQPPDAGRKDLSAVDTTSPGFHQESLIPLSVETHAGEDVAVHAMGPGSGLLSGVYEQSRLFHVMNQAADLEARANARLVP